MYDDATHGNQMKYNVCGRNGTFCSSWLGWVVKQFVDMSYHCTDER